MPSDPTSWASSLYNQLQDLQTRTFEDVMYSSNHEARKKATNDSSDTPGISLSLSDSALDKKHTRVEPNHPESARQPRGPGMHILFLSSDTGGGHRASAESLGKQFQLLFPGSTYELLDVVEKDGVPPYNSLVSAYKHLSNRPSQWKLVYNVSNSRAFEILADAHLKLMCEKAVRRRIESYNPDVVVSVHPLMTNVPVLSCSKISKKTGKHLPIFTVVTDLGSAHCLWFANGVEKMFVGSEAVKELAKARGKVPDEKLVLAGLPIRHDFAVQAELLGDRFSSEGRAYQRQIRRELQLPPLLSNNEVEITSGTCPENEYNLDRPTLLLMGGGEGVGSLENITDALYVELASRGIDALLLVVCGRNESLKSWIESRQWPGVYKRWMAAKHREEMKARGFSSVSSVDPFQSISLGSACIEPVDVAKKIRNIWKYTSSMGMTSTEPDNAESVTTTAAGTSEKEEVSIVGDGLRKLNSTEVTEEKKTDDPSDIVIRKVEKSQNTAHSNKSSNAVDKRKGEVTVVALGFVNQMAEYMVAADILITKAGPGTIAEAASLSLPVMLTSFLPGQEEGNVDFVVDGRFGAYCPVSDPIRIAEEVCAWIQNEEKLKQLSANAKLKGAPYAARDIAKSIGESTLRWMEKNQLDEENKESSLSTAESYDMSTGTND